MSHPLRKHGLPVNMVKHGLYKRLNIKLSLLFLLLTSHYMIWTYQGPKRSWCIGKLSGGGSRLQVDTVH